MDRRETERHEIEIKVRLTEADARVLLAIARREGIPPAVLARSMIKHRLPEVSDFVPRSVLLTR